MGYATASELKTYLGISGAGDDALIGALLDRATQVVDNYTGRNFAADTATDRVFDAAGPHIRGGTLIFDHDACEIDSITNGDGSSVDSTAYVTMPRNVTPYYGVKLKSNSNVVWTWTTDWESAITVSAKWGYSAAPPVDIVQATVQLAAFYYRKKDAPMQDVTAIEAGVVITPVAIPTDVKAILGHYRRY